MGGARGYTATSAVMGLQSQELSFRGLCGEMLEVRVLPATDFLPVGDQIRPTDHAMPVTFH